MKKSTRTLIIIMSVLVLVAFSVTQIYYSKLNSSVDPRIVPARNLYEKYNSYAERNDLDSVFYLMDTLEVIYGSVAHYAKSFEVGVIYNNRAAAWLTIGVFSELRDSSERDSIIVLAEKAVKTSIKIYTDWQKQFDKLDQRDIELKIRNEFLRGLSSYDSGDQEKYLQNRLKEIEEAKEEINRRLSVSYSNLGIAYRHQEQYDSAAISYEKAIALWDRNLTAENNLNILLDRPLTKRNFIQRLFPPERL